MNRHAGSTITPDAPEHERASYVAAWLGPAAGRAYDALSAAMRAEESAAELCGVEHYDAAGVVRLAGDDLDAAGYCTGTSAHADLHRLMQVAERKARATYDELTEMTTVYREGSWRTPDWDAARAVTRERIEAGRPPLGTFGRAFIAAAAGQVEAAGDGDEPPAPRSAPVSAARGPVEGDLDTAAARRRRLARDAVHPTLYSTRGNRG